MPITQYLRTQSSFAFWWASLSLSRAEIVPAPAPARNASLVVHDFAGRTPTCSGAAFDHFEQNNADLPHEWAWHLDHALCSLVTRIPHLGGAGIRAAA